MSKEKGDNEVLSPGISFEEIYPRKLKEGELKVMVEITKEEGEKGLATMSSDFDNFGLNVEKVLGKGPKRRAPPNGAAMATEGEEQEETIVVSATVPKDKLDALKSHPSVKYVSLTG